MRKSPVAAALAAAVVLAAPAVAAAPAKYAATLTGKSEVPRGNTKAHGSATFTVAANGRSIKYTLKASGLSGRAQAAHIHLGKPGAAGPVMIAISLKPFSLPRSGTLTAKQFTKVSGASTFAQAVKAVRAGRTYVNIHTKKFPGGEIRGQIHKG